MFDQIPISQALLQETYGKQWGEVVLRVKGLIATGLKTDICLRHPKIKQTSVQLVFFDTTFREWKTEWKTDLNTRSQQTPTWLVNYHVTTQVGRYTATRPRAHVVTQKRTIQQVALNALFIRYKNIPIFQQYFHLGRKIIPQNHSSRFTPWL